VPKFFGICEEIVKKRIKLDKSQRKEINGEEINRWRALSFIDDLI
jgi:hypothetical protein